MTSAIGPGLSADDLCRRLRAWPSASWQHGDRVRHTRAGLRRLAAVAAAARGEAPPPVPELAVTALGDQLAVLVADARRSGATDGDIATVLVELATDLRLTDLNRGRPFGQAT